MSTGAPGAGPAEELAALEAAASRLEDVARMIGEAGSDADELRALADEALALGAEITERLPRALRHTGPGGGHGPG